MKKIIITIGILALTLALFFIFKNVSLTPAVDNNLETTTPKVKIDPNVPNITLPFSNSPKDLAWAAFQKYLAYNKTRDLNGVKDVVYKIASVCENPQTRIDCEARMGAAYGYGSTFKKENFVNVWNDEKQIILATDFEFQEENNIIGRGRAIIFFIRDGENLKLLSFSPLKGIAVDKGATSKEELKDRLIRYTEDKDEDGIADYQEECLSISEGQACTKTDPKVRDSDNDGWWDGVEALMN